MDFYNTWTNLALNKKSSNSKCLNFPQNEEKSVVINDYHFSFR